MDWLDILKNAISLILRYLNLELVIAGYHVKFATVIIFSCLVGIIMYFLRGLSE